MRFSATRWHTRTCRAFRASRQFAASRPPTHLTLSGLDRQDRTGQEVYHARRLIAAPAVALHVRSGSNASFWSCAAQVRSCSRSRHFHNQTYGTHFAMKDSAGRQNAVSDLPDIVPHLMAMPVLMRNNFYSDWQLASNVPVFNRKDEFNKPFARLVV